LDGFLNGVEDREAFDRFPGFAWRDTPHHLGSVFLATLGVEGPCVPGDSLTNHPCVPIHKNAHDDLLPLIDVWIGFGCLLEVAGQAKH
jgi:hypothetical protein